MVHPGIAESRPDPAEHGQEKMKSHLSIVIILSTIRVILLSHQKSTNFTDILIGFIGKTSLELVFATVLLMHYLIG